MKVAESLKEQIVDRSIRIFTYLKELSELRTKTVTNTDEYEKVVWFNRFPKEKECSLAALNPLDPETSEVWIRLTRPKRTLPPVLPTELGAWISKETLCDSLVSPALSPTTSIEETVVEDGETRTAARVLHLIEHPDVDRVWSEYLIKQWTPWQAEDRRLAEVESVYTELYSFYQAQSKQGETFEAIIGLGLFVERKNGSIAVKRHAITARALLSFNRRTGEILVGPPADETKVELELDMVDPSMRPNPAEYNRLMEEVRSLAENIWDPVKSKEIIRALGLGLSATSTFVDSLNPSDAEGDLSFVYAPALILRKPGERRFIHLFQEIIRQLEDGAEVPLGVERLVTITDDMSNGESVDSEAGLRTPGDDEIFFPLPSNREQLEIAERIATRQGVLVQGPPGTGKSHTIVNLVSHLLAKGNRVLVTSHTDRALKVLKDKFPEEIESLCVSILGGDQDSLKLLEDSVHGILERHHLWDATKSEQEEKLLREKLHGVRGQIAKATSELVAIRETETRKHSNVADEFNGTLPTIARKLNETESQHSWHEDEIPFEQECPVTDEEFHEGLRYYSETDQQLREKISAFKWDESKLPEAATLSTWFETEARLSSRIKDIEGSARADVIKELRKLDGNTLHGVFELSTKIFRNIAEIRQQHYSWVELAVREVLSEKDRKWRTLLQHTSKSIGQARSLLPLVDRMTVTGLEKSGLDTPGALAVAVDLQRHFKSGGGLGFLVFKAAAVKNAEAILENVRANGKKLKDANLVESFCEFLRMKSEIEYMQGCWKGLLECTTDNLALQLEEFSDATEPLQALCALYDLCKAVEKKLPTKLVPSSWNNFEIVENLCCSIEQMLLVDELQSVARKFSEATSYLGDLNKRFELPEIVRLKSAIDGRDLESYIKALGALKSFANRHAENEKFKGILRSIGKLSPKLSARIEFGSKAALNGKSLVGAWRWKRARTWIGELTDPASYAVRKQLIEDLHTDERRILKELAANRAWAYCLQRMTEGQRQSLIAWKKAVQKIGKGTGKYANDHRKAAKLHMSECRGAIPAWIMPLHRVAEFIKPGEDRFDVAIIDEASQSGPEALVLHYLAKKIVVVGDDKQISPTHVMNREHVNLLRQRLIADIPHNSNIGVDDSFFDLAEIRFSGRIRLREHFRCMPEIIQFSNDLCYSSEPLIPLKQFGSSRLTPTVRTVHLADGYIEGSATRTWNPKEVDAVVSAVVGVCKDPAYAEKTLGVISLLGETQAKQIEQRLIRELGPEEFEKREIVCGDAYAFQGDERHVMFLSVVAAPTESRRSITALTKTEDMRRFNVAASRAQEQMWVFHSFLPEDQPNRECLRRKLVEYCLAPRTTNLTIGKHSVPELMKLAKDSDRRVARPPFPFDSWFEVDVFVRVHGKGHSVTPQFEISGRRLDMVVETPNQKFAIECDGDNWHGPEQYEADLSRQRDLERCGFKFWRVRESVFYLNPERAMESLWSLLGNERSSGESFGIQIGKLAPTLTEFERRGDIEEIQDEDLEVEENPQDNGQSGATDNANVLALSYGDVMVGLLDVLKSNGPMRARCAYRLLMAKYGVQRTGSRIASHLNKMVHRATKSGDLELRDECNRRGILDRYLFVPGAVEQVFPRGSRQVEDIPPSEIALILKEAMNKNPSLTKDDLLRSVSSAMGFGRIGSNIVSHFEEAWKRVAERQPS